MHDSDRVDRLAEHFAFACLEEIRYERQNDAFFDEKQFVEKEKKQNKECLEKLLADLQEGYSVLRRYASKKEDVENIDALSKILQNYAEDISSFLLSLSFHDAKKVFLLINGELDSIKEEDASIYSRIGQLQPVVGKATQTYIFDTVARLKWSDLSSDGKPSKDSLSVMWLMLVLFPGEWHTILREIAIVQRLCGMSDEAKKTARAILSFAPHDTYASRLLEIKDY